MLDNLNLYVLTFAFFDWTSLPVGTAVGDLVGVHERQNLSLLTIKLSLLKLVERVCNTVLGLEELKSKVDAGPTLRQNLQVLISLLMAAWQWRKEAAIIRAWRRSWTVGALESNL